MRVGTPITHDSVKRQRHLWGARALSALLLTLGLIPLGFAAQTRANFDHLTTGFELIGQHRDLPCESCHANAMFKGTPTDCGSCHGIGTVIRATAKPANHILSTDRCASCHTPIAWNPAVNFDHTQTRGSCSTCHNGVQAQGKGPKHIVTDLECDACHTTLTWAGAFFTHQGVTNNCASCHNGVAAQGMPPTHIPIGTPATPCEGCHSTTNFMTWAGTKINHLAVTAVSCQSCHETAAYLGMHPSTDTKAADSRPSATLDAKHPMQGDCGQCHDTTTFGNSALRPANHIPTSAPCSQCHTTAGNYKAYSVTGTHQGVTGCLTCHGPTVATTFDIAIVTTPGNHIPIGSLDCNGSGCHTTTNVNAGGFKLGTASISSPTLNVAGHATVAAAVGACQTCHEAAPYLGMLPGSGTTAGDSRPSSTLDSKHPASGDCIGCHTTTPTFATDQRGGALPPKHIPTSAPCAQCHTTAGNYALYSVTGTHQGVSGCLSCHGPTVATTFLNVTLVTTPGNHIPIGSLDCNGSGCHTTGNVTQGGGGFRLGTANTSNPTLSVAGHTTVAAAVTGCMSCHESAPYIGMLASSATTAGDSRPTALDKLHPTSGDCNGCHTTTPTFATDQTASALPPKHIPTTAPCTQCHTTAGNYVLYSSPGTHQGVSGCLTCHGPTVATTFLNVTLVTTPSNHIPIGSLDCNGSGCHTTGNVNPGGGGFKLGTASISNPTLSVTGHTTVAAAVTGCMSCHESAPYVGMLASTGTSAGDSRPSAALDKLHPTSGDCATCHTTAPTFLSDTTAGAKPSNHIPTSAPCAQCHTTAGNYALYSSPGTHQGVTGCLSCHGPTVGPFVNVTMVKTPGNHIPIGGLDCNGSGCHTTGNVSPGGGGFKLGAANISSPSLTVAGHMTVSAAVAACATCHETAPYMGMTPSTALPGGDSRPTAYDSKHPTTGDCGNCHVTTPTFATDLLPTAPKPANHIPTTAVCAQCHTTTGNFALYSVIGTHQGVTGCLSCHGPTVGPFVNVTLVTTPANHMPIGTLDCNGSGCHTTTNVNAGGFKLGTASIASPTLNVAGHTTVAAAVAGCQTCHESAPYVGMLVSTATTAGDSRPTALDKIHPTTGDCNGCHTTTPTFTTDQTGNAKPANHIPTTAPCAQCHTTAGNNALYSVTGTHQGVTGCLTCHGSTVAGTFANIKIVSNPSNHIPFGSLDCNGSGCHTAANVNAGGFKLGNANISTPTLTVAGHTTVAAAVSGCQTCHETSPYVGMLASTATTGSDSRPTAFDKAHPTSGDCKGCHTTAPTFITNQTGGSKPSNHIPTTAPCAQCHTTAGNYAAYSVTGTHQGVTGCLTCHGSTVGPFVNITMVTTPGNHIPIGSLDCNRSGCHSTGNVNPGGFRLGAANINTPTLTVAGHTTIATVVSGCQTCHESAPYVGMLASTATTGSDSRPTAFDKAHPTGGDCKGCHTTAPTFITNQTGGSKPSNHIPTTAPCAQCHTTAGNYATYSVTGTHQGVTGCLTCHGSTVAGTFANVKIVSTPSNHIPIGGLDCNGSGCHSTGNVNAGGFRLGAASVSAPTLTVPGHTTVAKAVSGCQTCHETSPYVGMLASTAAIAGDSRPSALDKAHPTSGDCNGCHTTTPTFTTNQMGSSAKPPNHIPTNAPCAQCHTTGGNYALYVMGPTGHAGITNNCKQCHAYGLSFYNMAPPTLKEPAAGATGHIPAVPPNGTGTLACELCHTSTGFTTFSGTVMRHAYVTSMTCMSCHETGMTWKTNGGLWRRPNGHHTGQDCGGSGCHSSRDKHAVRPGATVSTTPTKSGTGVTARTGVGPASRGGTAASAIAPVAGTAAPALGQPASTAGAAPAGPFNHATVGATACVSCHSAASGSGKPAAHLASTDTCQSCHTTLAWLPVRTVDHTQVKGTCLSCHNGIIASGKPSRHLPTSAGCGSCHTSNAWTPARFDHASVGAHTCISCHNSVQAIGRPRTHIPTTQQCDVCHGTLAWKPARIDHSGFTSGCATCHNNAGAVGLSPGHMSTRLDCATCHSYPDWSLIRFRHTSAAYPGTHRAALSCTSCHTSDTDQVPYRSPANAGTCAGCHAKDFKPAAHPKTVKGLTYTATELANCSGACHVYSDTTQSTITKSLPGPHHRVSDATFHH